MTRLDNQQEEDFRRARSCRLRENVNSLDSHLASGPEVGTTQGRRGENEPDCEPRSGTGNRDSECQSHADSDDSAVNFEQIFQKWQDQIQYGKRPSTVKQYRGHVRRLADTVDLGRYTLRQLKGQKNSVVIIEYLKTISRDQWRYAISGLKNFWKIGLRIKWPDADVKAFTGRLPPTGRNFVPREHEVRPWYSAIEKEPDVYRKLLVLLIAEFGWRPNHLHKLKVEDIQLSEDGMPDAIVADGNKRKFKTSAWIASYLPPYVRDTLREFNVEMGDSKRDDPLIPYRDSKGRIERSRPLNSQALYREWHSFVKIWKLPDLTPSAFRHFVCRTCESVGLSRSASGYLVGHESRQGETYRDWYSHVDVEEALEEQRTKFPAGIMGQLTAPEIVLTEGVPSQLLSLCSEFMAYKIGDIDFAFKAGSIRSQMVLEEAKHIEP